MKSIILKIVSVLFVCASLAGCFESEGASVLDKKKVELFSFINEEIVNNDSEAMYLTVLQVSLEASDEFYYEMWLADAADRRESYPTLLKELSLSELKERKDKLDLYMKVENYIGAIKNNKPILYGYENEFITNFDKVQHDSLVDYYIALHNQIILKSVGQEGIWGTKKLDYSKTNQNDISEKIGEYMLEKSDVLFIADNYLGKKIMGALDAYKMSESELKGSNFFFPMFVIAGAEGTSYLAANLGVDLADLRMQNSQENSREYRLAKDRKKRFSYVKRISKKYSFVTQL